MNPNCGQQGHGTECMCDVSVTTLTPIRFGLEDVWHSREIMNAVGMLGGIESSADVADFGEALLGAYDSWRAIDDAPNLRESVMNLLRAGTSMVDVPRLLGEQLEDVVAAVFKDRHSVVVGWSEVDWLTAEGVLYDEARKMSAREIGRRLGVNHHMVQTLCHLYGVVPNADANDRLASMREHLLAGLHPHDVSAAVAVDGYEATYNQCLQMRYKMVERGELDREMPPVRNLDAVAS